MPLCCHENHGVIQVLWAPGHYMPSKGSLHRNLSVLTVPCPFLWEKGKALYQRQQKKLSPSGVRTVMTHCPSISRASLERGICVASRWSHIWDPLPGRVQLRGWSGLHWHSRGHSGSPSFKASQPDSPFQLFASPFENLTGSSVDVKRRGCYMDSIKQREKLPTTHLQKSKICLFFSSIIYFLICEMGITALSHVLCQEKVLYKV